MGVIFRQPLYIFIFLAAEGGDLAFWHRYRHFSRGQAIQQGGVSVNDEKVTDVDFRFTPEMLEGEGALVRKGKKSYHRFVLA